MGQGGQEVKAEVFSKSKQVTQSRAVRCLFWLTTAPGMPPAMPRSESKSAPNARHTRPADAAAGQAKRIAQLLEIDRVVLEIARGDDQAPWLAFACGEMRLAVLANGFIRLAGQHAGLPAPQRLWSQKTFLRVPMHRPIWYVTGSTRQTAARFRAASTRQGMRCMIRRSMRSGSWRR